MTRASNAFSHNSHVQTLGGNGSCSRCHAAEDGAVARVTTGCGDPECHGRDVDERTVVRPTLGLEPGTSAAYVDAVHGLCIRCHHGRELAKVAEQPYLSRCTTCHQLQRSGPDSFEPDRLQLEHQPPAVLLLTRQGPAADPEDAA